ncbi:LysR substrate-binding domain-containing protein [Paraburkholderia silvatlantica]|uniref:DNA-binding transcriptional LysR family regulator n=1 Tax=Paraburkholderia silvatlantica TaxID=321895 RepID=A0A2U1ACB4_9BURK|nr:LysR substrate-binding domain-containing protein [Paraburkholderia silvatlantica]MBB2925741.1 DNA-binding transcriptional LysR family regulator [Paraburkholderia silvatlantica]PVY33143.1 DNA-binding transcriptional LysR family regulator [Paraburkholderia silvatlantica]PXW38035.1 DNA-binding transcriptional LysR family regulator [Paraburkholderia silvatlantica]PYE28011.1 DNA-binding transcriptional LysR family regulator [Paraburkholderia silvatlantica]TDQ92564.1 DNA-binding transcriptional L
MLNFREIQAFRAVMLSGSMTQAAKDLHTSQSNISRVISQLERRIGVKLFERQIGKLMPTLEGQVFFRDVEHTFASLRGLEEKAESIRKRGSGRLRVAAVPSMAIVAVPDAIHLFAQRFPDVDVTLQVADSLTVCQWLATGYADVGIASEIFNGTSVASEVVRRSQGVCIVPSDHRLAQREGAVTPADLIGERFLSLKSSDVMRKRIDDACLIDGEDKRILAYESHFAAAICRMVVRGMGVSLMNQLVAREYADQLAILPFSKRIEFATYVVYPLNIPMNMLAKSFADAFRESSG